MVDWPALYCNSPVWSHYCKHQSSRYLADPPSNVAETMVTLVRWMMYLVCSGTDCAFTSQCDQDVGHVGAGAVVNDVLYLVCSGTDCAFTSQCDQDVRHVGAGAVVNDVLYLVCSGTDCAFTSQCDQDVGHVGAGAVVNAAGQ